MHTLGELIDIVYEESWRHQKNGETSRRNAECVAMYIGPSSPVTDVMDHHLRNASKEFEAQGNTGATINRKMSAFGKVMARAEALGYVDRVPKAIRRPESAGRIRWYSKEEEKRILNSFDFQNQSLMTMLTEFLIDTGMRLSEALRVNMSHVSGELIHVWETKADLPRTIPMTRRVKMMIEFANEGKLLFLGLTVDQAEARWAKMRKALKKTDDPDFVMHTCRHTCASRLVSGGVSMAVVQAWLGHKSIATTMRYAHLRPEALMEAVKVLE